MGIIGILVAFVGGRENPLLFLAALVPVACFMLPFVVVRQIRFDDKIFVDRFFVPSYELAYADVLDVGTSGFKTKKRGFSLAGVKNVDDFHGMLAYAMTKRGIPQSQFEGKMAKQEAITWRTIVFAQLAAIPLTLVLAFLVPSVVQVFGKLTFIFVFAVVSFPVWWFVKRTSRPN